MKTQKSPEQTMQKEELNMQEIKRKYGGEDFIEIDYIVEEQTQRSKKETERSHHHEYKRRMKELHEELKQIKTDLDEARKNGRDTGPIYKEKQNIEEKFLKLRSKWLEESSSDDDKTDTEKNLEKAKLLTRQGIVNIRPAKGEYDKILLRKIF
jgi:hypothetical protein